MAIRTFILCMSVMSCVLCASCQPTNTPEQPAQEEPVVDSLVLKAVAQPHKSPKRGVCFDFKNTEDVFLMYKFVSWSYNWGPSEDDGVAQYLDMTDIVYYPMAWTANFNEAQIAKWIGAHPQTKYILGFNEPNLKDQCNMTPRQVADAWPRLKHLADSLGVDLVSPAMNYGTLSGYSDPIKWLDEFFTYIPIEQSGIKVIAIHCYMNTAAAVKGYIERFYKYNLPIWMTEFCAWDGGVSGMIGQMDYMADVITFMELNPRVERYAWFMPRTSSSIDAMPYNQLLTHGIPSELTPLGHLFATLPNMAEPKLQDAAAPWDMTKFASCRQTEFINAEGLCNAPHFRMTDDTMDGAPEMMMYNFSQEQWVEYTVQAAENLATMNIRYQSTGEPILTLNVDGGKSFMIVLPSSADWSTYELAYPLNKGAHKIRLTMTQGFCNLSTVYWN